jgi:hypothetical protein
MPQLLYNFMCQYIAVILRFVLKFSFKLSASYFRRFKY